MDEAIWHIKNSREISDEDFNGTHYFFSGNETRDCKIYERNAIKESILVGDKKRELRTRIFPIKPNTFECMQVQICTRYLWKDRYFVGSGTMNRVGDKFGSVNYYVLTAAHNLTNVHKIIGGTLSLIPKDAGCRFGKDDKDFSRRIKLDNVSVLPDYLLNHSILDGSDLAISFVKYFDERFYSIPKNCWSTVEQTGATKGDVIKVIGFPGEYDGDLYCMNGTIKEIKTVRKGRKVILYETLNTTPGQSGSGVYLKRDDKWIQIGVHAGCDESHQVNIGIAITESISKWIHEQCSKAQDLAKQGVIKWPVAIKCTSSDLLDETETDIASQGGYEASGSNTSTSSGSKQLKSDKIGTPIGNQRRTNIRGIYKYSDLGTSTDSESESNESVLCKCFGVA